MNYAGVRHRLKTRAAAFREWYFSSFAFSVFYLVLAFAALIVIVSLVFWMTIRYFTVQYQYEQLDNEMREIISISVLEVGKQRQIEKFIEVIGQRVSVQDPTGPYVYAFWSANQPVSEIAGNLTQIPVFEYDRQGRGKFDVLHEGRTYRYHGRAVRLFDAHVLLVGRKITDNMVLIEPYGGILLALSLIVIGIGGSKIFSNFLTRRMQKFNNTIIDVRQSGDLSRRIPVPKSKDPISNTAKLFNDMMKILQVTTDQKTVVINNTAHRLSNDIRTVQRNLRLSNEKIASLESEDHKKQEEIARELKEAAEAADKMNVHIGKIYKTLRESRMQFVTNEYSLSHLNDECEISTPDSEFWKKVKDKCIQVTQNPEDFDSRKIEVSSVHLISAIDDLLDNAAKFTPENGTIRFYLESGEDGVTIVVSNTGNGIDSEERERLLQMYEGLDEVHTGLGMGLQNISSTARTHGVRFELDDESPGTSQPGLKASLGPFPLVGTV